ncbi:MAG: FAD-dependent oxidoreductase, partial [Clostridia bacterium]|nr:FAD-dependent oxidoreductase [Clostridia bacterium]
MVYDVAIIGAGVVGTLIARAFSKYDMNVVLIEKTADVAMGTTKANSGIVHAGFDAQSGTMKAKLNVRGCALMEDLCKELFVPYEKNGSLVVAFNDQELETIKVLYDRGITNGVPDMEIIDAAKLRELEPNISEEAKGALWAKSAGIVSPYELAIAAAECACGNGVELKRNFDVDAITFADGVFSVKCKCGCEVAAKVVINAAGLGAAEIAKKFNGEEYEVI